MSENPPGEGLVPKDLTVVDDQGEPTNAPTDQPYNPEKARDELRGKIAGWLIALLGFIVLASFMTLWLTNSKLTDGVKDILTIVFGPVTALVGSAIGYYFGGATKGGAGGGGG